MEEEKFFFEGVEKVMEIDFAPGYGPERGLRELTRDQLNSLCDAARCTIISSMSNSFLDSYVLSESSLFVYPTKMILKTCGTTTLLMTLEPLLEYTMALGMKVEWVAYTRKDFQRPGVQKFPHRDPKEESDYLTKFFPEGHAFMLGPITGDHWVVYVADYVDRQTDSCVDRTLDMMMFGIDEEVAKLFMTDKARFPKDTDVTKASGIATLLPGSQIQEFCFDPCGYSMNGLLYDSYWTIHITPESHCSYASFETNIRMSNYSALMKAVLAIFRPRKWTMTLFADTAGMRAIKESPFQSVLTVPVVESEHTAIMGPCVFSRDAYGNSLLSFTETAAGAVDTPAASPTSPVSSSGSFPVVVASASSSGLTPKATPPSTPSDSTSPDPITMAPVTVVTKEEALPTPEAFTEALLASVAASRTVSTGLEESKVSLPSIVVTPTVGRRSPPPRKAAVSYLMTTKSHTEFIGEYTAVLGNFVLVNSATEAHTPGPVIPRAKYVVAKSVKALQGKTRTESC